MSPESDFGEIENECANMTICMSQAISKRTIIIQRVDQKFELDKIIQNFVLTAQFQVSDKC
jgi:hypothetical protein